MIACRGRVQREGEVIHVVVEHLTDLSQELRSVGARDLPFPIERGRGDGATHPGSADSREQVAAASWRTRDIYVPDGRFDNATSRCRRGTSGEPATPRPPPGSWRPSP